MPTSDKVFPHKEITIFTADGEISYSEASEAISRYYRSNDPSLTKNILGDLRNASLTLLTAPQVTNLADLSSSYSEQRGGGQTAIVVSNDLNFGIAKEFEAQVIYLPSKFKLFRDIDEAYKWFEE